MSWPSRWGLSIFDASSVSVIRFLGPLSLIVSINPVLHLGRADALKRIVLPQPNPHPPGSNPSCNPESQKAISRAWTLSSAYMVTQNHPGEVGAMIARLGEHLECAECRRSLEERVSRLVRD